MIFFKNIFVCLIVGSYLESCHSEQGMRFDGSLQNKMKFRGTHIIGHAHGNNDIAKSAPNIPYLQNNVIWEKTYEVIVRTPWMTKFLGVISEE